MVRPNPEELKNNPESIPADYPYRIGTERQPWKSILFSVDLTAVGSLGSYLLANRLFGGSIETLHWEIITPAIGTVISSALALYLTTEINIFREDVNRFFGKGELHPKSPALLSRS